MLDNQWHSSVPVLLHWAILLQPPRVCKVTDTHFNHLAHDLLQYKLDSVPTFFQTSGSWKTCIGKYGAHGVKQCHVSNVGSTCHYY